MYSPGQENPLGILPDKKYVRVRQTLASSSSRAVGHFLQAEKLMWEEIHLQYLLRVM